MNDEFVLWRSPEFNNLGGDHDGVKEVFYAWQGGGPELRPTLVSTKVVKVAFGSDHIVWLTADNTVLSQGGNLYGQLGNGTVGGTQPQPHRVAGLSDLTVVDIACGSQHTAALTDSGAIYCWGDGSRGQCGVGFTETVSTPQRVDISEDRHTCEHGIDAPGRQVSAHQVACGDKHTAIVSQEAEIWTWGSGHQLGLGAVKETSRPTKVDFLSGRRVLSVSCGSNHTVSLVSRASGNCARTANVKVHRDRPSTCSKCNKEVYSIQEESDMCVITDEHKCPLGLDLQEEVAGNPGHIEVVNSDPSKDSTSVKNHSKHSIFDEEETKEFLLRQLQADDLPSKDAANSTQRNDSLGSRMGALFSGAPFRTMTDAVVDNLRTTVDRFRFVTVDKDPLLSSDEAASDQASDTVSLSESGEHSDAAEPPRRVSTLPRQSVPTISLRKRLDSMETSFSSDCLTSLRTDGARKSGSQQFSMRRSRSAGSIDPCFSIPTCLIHKWKDTNIDYESSVCLDTEVWAWGSNQMGQLGLGDSLNRIQPACLETLSGRRVVKVCVGGDHNLALTVTGQVYSWGSNQFGQLGQSDSEDTPSEVKLLSSQSVWDVAAGLNHSILVADMGPQPEVYYCGQQYTERSAANKTDHKVQPIRLIDFRRKVGWVRRVSAGGQYCACTVDKKPDVVSGTLYEISASERSFCNQLSVMSAALCRPMQALDSYTAIQTSIHGLCLHGLLECFARLLTSVAHNSVELTRAVQGLQPFDSVFVLGRFDDFVSVFEQYSKRFCDLLAVGGFENLGKNLEAILMESKAGLEKLSELSKVEISSDTAKTLCRLLQIPLQRLSVYSRLVGKLASGSESHDEMLESDRESHRGYRAISLAWELLKRNTKEDRSQAELTRKFWDSCSPKLAEMLKVPGRRLLRESRTHPLSLVGASRFSMNWLMLFTDAFILAQYSSHQSFPLDTIWVDTSTPDPDSQQYTFQLITPEESLQLSAPSSAEKSEWLLCINQAIQAVVAGKKKSLRTQVTTDLSPGRRQSASNLYTPPVVRQASHKFYKTTSLKGSKYTGTWHFGKRHGHGELVDANGSKYVGRFKNGQFHGLGVLSTPKGLDRLEVYEGNWSEGKKHGCGKISYANGDVYEGYFKSNQRHGHGILKRGHFKSQQASVYIGEWVNDKRSGYGVMDDIQEGEKYMGMWQTDLKHGRGVVVTLDGLYYEGTFNGGRMSGFGVALMPDFSSFEGEFYDKDQPYGKGTLTFPTGDTLIGQFNGQLSGDLKISNGTYSKALNQSELRSPFLRPDEKNFGNYGKLSVSADLKWPDIFRHCYCLLGAVTTDTMSTKKSWEEVAILVSNGRKNCKDGMDDILERIPPQDVTELTEENYEYIKNYLEKASQTHYHPVGKLFEGLVDVYRATYFGVGANSRLLYHAVDEVRSYLRRVYEVVRLLFPYLPPDGHRVRLSRPARSLEEGGESDSDEDDGEVVSASTLLEPLLLPRVYPVLFTLYALHNEAQDERYWERTTRWNRQSDVSLMSFLGMDEKFWLVDSNLVYGRLATIKDKSYLEPIETLQQISTTFCPSDKLDVVQKAFTSINKAVQQSMKANHVWCMDDLFPVFQYVVVRARIHNLGAEIHLLQDTMQTHLEFGELGIMFTTLKACYFQIQHEKSTT